MEQTKKKNKTSHIIGTAILSIWMPGLGHIYCGEIKRGIILFILFQASHLAFFLLVQPFQPLNVIVPVIIYTSIYLFTIGDSVNLAKNPENRLNLKPLIVSALLIGLIIINSSIIYPVMRKAVRDNLVQAFRIASLSMSPSLLIGDHIFVDKRAHARKPERGDIIVFNSHIDTSRTIIRRLVGLSGEIIEIKDSHLYINNIKQEEDYLRTDQLGVISAKEQLKNFGPATVPEDSVFVLGDNRIKSHHNHSWGFLDENLIIGKAATVYWSWDRDDSSIRWSRIGKVIN